MQMTLGVTQPPRQTLDPVTIHHSVGYQTHRAPDQIGPPVPLRRTRGRIGTAALASAKPGGLSIRGRGVEPDVLALGGTRGAARTAIDSGRSHRAEHPPVKSGIARLHHLPTAI